MVPFWKHIKKATPEQEEEFSKALEENKVGFKDGLAMVLSAFCVIVLPCLLVLLALGFLIMLFFGAFG